MLIAVAAMAFVSCQKDETAAPETVSATLTLNASVDQTKTYLDGNTVLWGKGEAVSLYVGTGEGENATAKFFDSASTDVYDGEETASFTFTLEDVPTKGPYSLGGIYPASAAKGISNNNPESFKIALPATQNPEVGKYDPSAYIMVLKPETVETLPTEYKASFRRATALNKITLTNVKEDITTVEITVPTTKFLAGRRYFNLTTGESGEVYENGGRTNTIKVNSTYGAGTIEVWFTSWGIELVEGETMKVVLKSESKTYEKTITARAEGIKFVEGRLNTLTIDMTSIEGVTSAVALPFVEDFAAITSGNNTSSNGSGTAVDNAMMSQFSHYASATYQAGGAVRIGKSGELRTKELDLSEDFHVIVSAKGWSASELRLTVTAGSQTNDIELTTYMASDFVDYIINFDAIDNSEVVKFTTTSTQRCFIDKIQILKGHAELPSILTATEPELMGSEGGEGSFAYTLKNPKEGQELSASTEADWITEVTVNDGNVTYIVSENTSEEAREATITLKYEGVNDVNVTVKQAGYVDPNVIHKVTVAEFKSLTGTETATYELTGKITEIYQVYNSQYGNISFHITDETTTVLIFRMSCDEELGKSIKVGDQITVQGSPTKYNDQIQMAQGGICIEYFAACAAPVITCLDNIVTIEAEEGATIYYTTDGSDPTTESTKYIAEFEIEEDTTVKAIAVATGKEKSVVTEKSCTYVDPNAGGGDSSETITVSNTIANIADANAWANSKQYKTINLDDVITATVSGGGNTGKYYTSGENWRIYQSENPTLVISADDSYTIKTVKITYSVDKTGVLTYNKSNITSGTVVDVNAASITFGVGNTGSATNGQVRVTAIEVVYQKN